MAIRILSTVTLNAYRSLVLDIKLLGDTASYMLEWDERSCSWTETVIQNPKVYDTWRKVIEGVPNVFDQPVAKWKKGQIGRTVGNYDYQVTPGELPA